MTGFSRNVLLVAALLLPQLPAAIGQGPAKLPEFDVASVKPTSPTSRAPIGLFTYPGGRVVCSACPLQYLIMEAFHLQSNQIVGVPDWIKGPGAGDGFDVEARPSATSASSKSNPASFKSPPNDEQRQMLQALLIERFHLKFHYDTKEGSVYFLEKSGKPLRLRTPKDSHDFSWAIGTDSTGALIGPNGPGLSGVNISMADFAIRLTGYMGRPVIDHTELQGAYDFDSLVGSEPGTDIHAAISSGLSEVGLKLTSAKGPVEALVIDSAEKPSSN